MSKILICQSILLEGVYSFIILITFNQDDKSKSNEVHHSTYGKYIHFHHIENSGYNDNCMGGGRGKNDPKSSVVH